MISNSLSSRFVVRKLPTKFLRNAVFSDVQHTKKIQIKSYADSYSVILRATVPFRDIIFEITSNLAKTDFMNNMHN